MRVALCDLNGDGILDVVVGAGPTGDPHVRAFDGASGAELFSFYAYPIGLSGGVFEACGDVNRSNCSFRLHSVVKESTPRIFDITSIRSPCWPVAPHRK